MASPYTFARLEGFWLNNLTLIYVLSPKDKQDEPGMH